MDANTLMTRAIESARRGIQSGQSPFGCAIAQDGQVIAVEHNRVVATTDITAHAEVLAIRSACKATSNIFLTGSVVATTCEPCPMCMAALHWARVDTVYFGASIADAARAKFNEMQLPASEVLERGKSAVRLVPGIMVDECRVLFDEWLQNANRTPY